MMNKSERETMEKLQTQLAAVQTELNMLKTSSAAEIDRLTKEVSTQKSYAEMYSRSSAKAENELEAAHSLLDGLPQAPPSETPPKESYGSPKNIPLATRLANWVARVAFCDAFAKAGMK